MGASWSAGARVTRASASATALATQLIASRWTPVAIIVLGLALRLLWLWRFADAGGQLAGGEAMNVAHAIQQRGEFADAFHPGQGPTAHLMPIPGLIAGGVYWLLGFQSRAAEAFLATWAMALVFASFWLQFKTFSRLGLSRLEALSALVFLCVVPTYFAFEAVMFRVWEGGLAVALGSLFLYLLVRWDEEAIERSRIVPAGLLLALLLFVHPLMGLAALVAAMLFVVRTIPRRRWLETAAIAAASIFIVFLPWIVRNEAVMHHAVITRSDLGLEMAVAFSDETAATSNPQATFRERFRRIHPINDGAAYIAMKQAGGEVAYSKKLERETLRWMSEHPVGTLRLMTRHVVEVLFPPNWYFEEGKSRAAHLVMLWLVSALGLAGILRAVTDGDRRFLYPVIMTVLMVLPYALTQPMLRYRYLIIGLLVNFSVYFVGRMHTWYFSRGQERDELRPI